MPTPTCILPSRFLARHYRAAKIWALIRAMDHPDNGGTGCGRVKCSITELASHLRQSHRSVYRHIKEALDFGFFQSVRSLPAQPGWIEVHYFGLSQVGRNLYLDAIGPIAEFNLEELPHAKVKATEAAAEWLQNASYHLMREQWGRYAKEAPRADDLLTNSKSVKESGVQVARGQRLLYLAPNWRPFGASQQRIAEEVGCSERTIGRRFSNDWRSHHNQPSILKLQTAQQILEDCSKREAKAFVRVAGDDAKSRLVFLGKRLFLVGTNLYEFPQTWLRSQRFRKGEFLRQEREREQERKRERERTTNSTNTKYRAGSALVSYLEGLQNTTTTPSEASLTL